MISVSAFRFSISRRICNNSSQHVSCSVLKFSIFLFVNPFPFSSFKLTVLNPCSAEQHDDESASAKQKQKRKVKQSERGSLAPTAAKRRRRVARISSSEGSDSDCAEAAKRSSDSKQLVLGSRHSAVIHAPPASSAQPAGKIVPTALFDLTAHLQP